MSEPTAQRHSSSHAIRSATASALTEVEVTWIEKRCEQWIRFGRIAADTIINAARASSPSVPARSSPSCAGPRTTMAPSIRASTS